MKNNRKPNSHSWCRGIISWHLVLILLAVCTSWSARAAQIVFESTNLPDLTAGEDIWSISYQVSGFSFQKGEGFTILFDPGLYSNLQSPPPAINLDWDIISVQPDPKVPEVGFYDALALVDGATLKDNFQLRFVFFGTGKPDNQPFEIHDVNFDAVAFGSTMPVPLPGLGLIYTACLILVIRFGAFRSRHRR